MSDFWDMYFDFNYVIALCICTVVFIICICMKVYQKEKGWEKNLTAKMGICILLFSVYVTFLLGVTLLNRQMGSIHQVKLQPLWSYVEACKESSWGWWSQIIYNIVAFVPMGFFVPMIFERMRKFIWVLILGGLTSVGIEVFQLVLRCGLMETDDIVNNTMGVIMGYGIWWRCTRTLMQSKIISELCKLHKEAEDHCEKNKSRVPYVYIQSKLIEKKKEYKGEGDFLKQCYISCEAFIKSDPLGMNVSVAVPLVSLISLLLSMKNGISVVCAGRAILVTGIVVGVWSIGQHIKKRRILEVLKILEEMGSWRPY